MTSALRLFGAALCLGLLAIAAAQVGTTGAFAAVCGGKGARRTQRVATCY